MIVHQPRIFKAWAHGLRKIYYTLFYCTSLPLAFLEAGILTSVLHSVSCLPLLWKLFPKRESTAGNIINDLWNGNVRHLEHIRLNSPCSITYHIQIVPSVVCLCTQQDWRAAHAWAAHQYQQTWGKLHFLSKDAWSFLWKICCRQRELSSGHPCLSFSVCMSAFFSK